MTTKEIKFNTKTGPVPLTFDEGKADEAIRRGMQIRVVQTSNNRPIYSIREIDGEKVKAKERSNNASLSFFVLGDKHAKREKGMDPQCYTRKAFGYSSSSVVPTTETSETTLFEIKSSDAERVKTWLDSQMIYSKMS